jgi:hypothetical protein
MIWRRAGSDGRRSRYFHPVRAHLELHDGERLALDDKQAAQLFDQLWVLVATTRGALSAAAKVRRAHSISRGETLDEAESAAVRVALAGIADRGR